VVKLEAYFAAAGWITDLLAKLQYKWNMKLPRVVDSGRPGMRSDGRTAATSSHSGSETI
jgi:hypothetical protein